MASQACVKESLLPESKKQKLEQDSDDDIPVGGGETDDDGDNYDPPLSDFGGSEKLRSQWLERRQRFIDSDGFDVGPYDGTLIDGCHLMDLDEEGDDSNDLPSLQKCARYAIDYWNKEHKGEEELRLSKILQAVYASSRGDLFHITLEAEVGPSRVKKVFQTKVMDDFIENEMKVFLFRAKEKN